MKLINNRREHSHTISVKIKSILVRRRRRRKRSWRTKRDKKKENSRAIHGASRNMRPQRGGYVCVSETKKTKRTFLDQPGK